MQRSAAQSAVLIKASYTTCSYFMSQVFLLCILPSKFVVCMCREFLYVELLGKIIYNGDTIFVDIMISLYLELFSYPSTTYRTPFKFSKCYACAI